MKISFSQNQLFDMVGFPLVSGRVSFFLHGSDVPASIYTLDGENFIEATNPVILDDAGSFPQTVFMEAAIYDVRVEKLTDGTYSTIETYQFGFRVPDVKNDTIVEGIYGLAHANPELGSVTVVGYDGITYAGPRTYIWDDRCTDAEDGGCIIASETTENGRWLLLSDLREMPCTYFGIEAGREANMSAFLTYQPVVGTYGIFMPPVPRFLKGNYVSENTFSTNKVLSFDQDAKLTRAFIVCAGIEVSPRSGYVGDFQFTNQQFAESSWFRSVKRFWKCQARELHQSRTNYFVDSNTGNYGTTCAILMNQKITGTPVTQTGSGSLTFNHCIIDDYALSTTWYAVFKNCDFSDRWFNDANWDFGVNPTHRQLVRNSENRVSVDNFADANVFVLQQAANSVTSIDLQNRSVSNIIASMPFSTIKNAVIDTAHFDSGISLEHCSVNHLYLESGSIAVITKDCVFAVEQADFSTWNDTDSNLALGCDIDTTFSTVSWNGTGANLNSHRIGRNVDDLAVQRGITLWHCTLSNGVIASSAPVVLDCNIVDTPIYVYPYSILENLQQSWSMGMEFRGNRFNGTSSIKIGAHNGLSDHLGEVFECRVTSISITDNVFNTSSMGVTCPFWAGPGLAFRFIRGLTSYDPAYFDRNLDLFPIKYEYKNNSGNCPKQYAQAQNMDMQAVYAECVGWNTVGSGNDFYVCAVSILSSVFVMPALANPTKAAIPDPTSTGTTYLVDKLSVCTSYRMKALASGVDALAGSCFDFPRSAYLPACAVDKSQPNDMFACWLGAMGALAQQIGVNPMPSGE